MDNGKGVSAGCMRIRYSSPRKAMARWFSSPVKVKGRKTVKAKVPVRDFGYDMVKTRICPENSRGDVEHSDSLPQTIDSEMNRRDVLFMGVSCCLLHLIATCREEIHKITQLRNELENVLECHNGDILRKQQEFVKLRNNVEKFMECHNDELLQRRQQEFLCGRQEQSETSAYSTTTDVLDDPESSSDHHYSPQIPETSTRVGHRRSLQRYVFNRRDDIGEEMDQLEAELEAEFQILQIGQNQEGKHSKLKEIAKNSDEESEDLTLEYIGPRPVEEQGGGVCPYELTGRLYELMETRQEEEIKELKTALEDAKYRLHFMETEVSKWKNKAYIVSEHIPEPSRITSKSGTHRRLLSR